MKSCQNSIGKTSAMRNGLLISHSVSKIINVEPLTTNLYKIAGTMTGIGLLM